jgi:predicted acetyltransferase
MGSTTPSKSDVERSGHRSSQDAELFQKSHNPHFLSSSSKRGTTSRAAWRAVSASAGDHQLIHQFLVSVFHRPSATEFQAQLEHPTYEPADRLVIKDGGELVAHLRLQHRELRFGNLVLPCAVLTDLATLPEYQGHGCATALLEAACKVLLRDGIVLGLLATQQPRFFARRGWFVAGRHCYSASAPREILSYLKQRETERIGLRDPILGPQAPKRYNIRLWRHVELAALTRLYDENMQNAFGCPVRTDAYWRWLVSRGGNQRIYVAIDGPDKLELDEALTPIVGYAATREGRIIEIMNSAAHGEAAVQLLARACGDAIEKDFIRVRLDAPPQQPLHQLFIEASGDYGYHEADQGMVFMAHLLKPRRFLKLISQDLAARAKDAGLPRPCQLGLLINKEKYRLSVSRRGVELIPGTLGRSYLTCSLYEFSQLLLGHVDLREAIRLGRLSVSTRVAEEMAVALFPRLPLWLPPWDNLPAV